MFHYFSVPNKTTIELTGSIWQTVLEMALSDVAGFNIADSFRLK